jgi:hypothetical protein
MDLLTRLEAIEDIKQLKARYFRGIDTKDWDLLRTVFTDDAVLDNRRSKLGPVDESARFSGGDHVVEYVRSAAGPAVTAHLGVMPEITVLSETEAEGVWKMEDVVTFPEGVERHERFADVRRIHGYGHYHERYRKADGEWRIAHCVLTRISLELER